mgnify:CR=1 FL=1
MLHPFLQKYGLLTEEEWEALRKRGGFAGTGDRYRELISWTLKVVNEERDAGRCHGNDAWRLCSDILMLRGKLAVGYDLLGQRWVRYAYAYPFLEATAAVLMAGRLLPWLSIPIALFIGTVGAVSVFYAVYVQKREIKCACVGGSANVPLGFISLTENLAMMGMGIWMLLRPAL